MPLKNGWAVFETYPDKSQQVLGQGMTWREASHVLNSLMLQGHKVSAILVEAKGRR